MQKRIADLSLAAEAKRQTEALQEYLSEHRTHPHYCCWQEEANACFPCCQTFESARSSLPADRAIVQQASPAPHQVFPPKHAAIFELSQRLWLHLVVYVLKSGVFLVDVDLRVHLDDGLFDQTQRSSQIRVLFCSSCRREQPKMSYAFPEHRCIISNGG